MMPFSFSKRTTLEMGPYVSVYFQRFSFEIDRGNAVLSSGALIKNKVRKRSNIRANEM